MGEMKYKMRAKRNDAARLEPFIRGTSWLNELSSGSRSENFAKSRRQKFSDFLSANPSETFRFKQ